MSKANEIGNLMAKSILLYGDWAKRQGISYNQLAVFFCVLHNPNCTQKMIAEQWALPKQTVFSLCKQLKEQGFLIFEQESEDKREKFLRLTEQGRAFAQPIIDKLEAVEQMIIHAFGEVETEQFIEQLQRFNHITHEKMKE